MDQMVADAHAKGYVTTMFGRRRDLPAIKSRNFNQRMLAERMAMNTPIQAVQRISSNWRWLPRTAG